MTKPREQSGTPATEKDKQTKPMRGEVTPENAKIEAFRAVQQAKRRFRLE